MDIDTMVESHFKKNRDVFGFESIAQLIEEVMDSMEAAGVPILDHSDAEVMITEAATGEKFSATKFFDAIFTPNMTEEVGQVGTAEREAFTKIMKKITGKSLEVKLEKVKAFIDGTGPEAKAQSEHADTVLSYLVFLKTMAEVFQQYSPSGSGFLLEAFLAGLMSGRQVVDTEEGSLPIVDYEQGHGGTPVSLKRLTGGEGGTEIKGSLTNLGAHIAKNPVQGVDYVIAAITPGSDGGKISFYEFNINAESLYQWVGKYILLPGEWDPAWGPGPGAAESEAAPPDALPVQEAREGSQVQQRMGELQKLFFHRVGAVQKALGVVGTEEAPAIDKKLSVEDGRQFPLLKGNKASLKALSTDYEGVSAAARHLASRKEMLKFMESVAGEPGAPGFQVKFKNKILIPFIPAEGDTLTQEDVVEKIIRREFKELAGLYRRGWDLADLGSEDVQKILSGGHSLKVKQVKGVTTIQVALDTLKDFSKDTPVDLPSLGEDGDRPGLERTFVGAATLLGSAFRATEKKLPPTGTWFSKGGGTYTRSKKSAVKYGTGVKGSLADLVAQNELTGPDFAAWVGSNPKGFLQLIKYSIAASAGTEKVSKKDKAAADKSLEEMIQEMLTYDSLLTEAAGKKKGQFSISQGALTGGEYYINTIDISRKRLVEVTTKYNTVVKDRLAPIFMSVDKLMSALQRFYIDKKISAGEEAATECETLKGATEKEITTAKEQQKTS